MEAYLAVLREIAQYFDKFELTKIPRGDNTSAALASTLNPAVRRVIPVEGIEKPSINLSCKEVNLQGNNPPHIDAIITRSKAQRTTKSRNNETDSELDDRQSPREPPVRTRRTATPATLSEEPDHETNNEAHEAFNKEIEARTNWKIPIYNNIKDGELPGERWEAQKIKARSSRYYIIEETLYKRSINEPYLLSVSLKDAFAILKQTHDGSCMSHFGGLSFEIMIKIWLFLADDRRRQRTIRTKVLQMSTTCTDDTPTNTETVHDIISIPLHEMVHGYSRTSSVFGSGSTANPSSINTLPR